MELTESTEIQYIDVNREQIPCSFSVKLSDRTYRLTIQYNEHGDFFTVDLEQSGSPPIPLCYGEVIRYGKPLFEAFNDDQYPLPVIVAQCLTGDNIDTITYENFGETVKLYLYPRPGV